LALAILPSRCFTVIIYHQQEISDQGQSIKQEKKKRASSSSSTYWSVAPRAFA
jgi:hypothetical protein